MAAAEGIENGLGPLVHYLLANTENEFTASCQFTRTSCITPASVCRLA